MSTELLAPAPAADVPLLHPASTAAAGTTTPLPALPQPRKCCSFCHCLQPQPTLAPLSPPPHTHTCSQCIYANTLRVWHTHTRTLFLPRTLTSLSLILSTYSSCVSVSWSLLVAPSSTATRKSSSKPCSTPGGCGAPVCVCVCVCVLGGGGGQQKGRQQ